MQIEEMHKDFEVLIQSQGYQSTCKYGVENSCSMMFGATAKADVCNQGGSYCAFIRGGGFALCTDDASCTKKPCCNSLARDLKAQFELLCTGSSFKKIDDWVSTCPGL